MAERGRVLVTGATGTIGRSVVAALERDGRSVRAFARSTLPQPPATRRTDLVEWMAGNITDPRAVTEAMAGCDDVIHLAAIAHQRGPSVDAAHEAVTYGGSRVVFDVASEQRVRRVVLASSIAVYGTGGTFDERSVLRPSGAYGRAKVRAEDDLLGRSNRDGRPLGTVLRYATVYGPGAAGNVTAMLSALARRRFLVVGSGHNHKSLLFVDDAAGAALAALSERAAGEVYDVADGQPRPVDEVVAMMCDALGRRPPRVHVPAGPLRAALRGAASVTGALGRDPIVDPGVVDTLVSDVVVRAAKGRTELLSGPVIPLAVGLERTVAAEPTEAGLQGVRR